MGDGNLIPRGRAARRRRKIRLWAWAAMLAAYSLLLAAGSLTLGAMRAGKGDDLAGQLAAVGNQVARESQAIVDLRRNLAQATVILETARAIHDQPDWSRLFLGVSAHLGEQIVLTRCQLMTLTENDDVLNDNWEGLPPNKMLGTLLAGCRHDLLLTGFGQTQESVSQFILRLEETGVFDAVQLLHSSRQPFLDGEAVAFRAKCRL